MNECLFFIYVYLVDIVISTESGQSLSEEFW